ncbi:SLC24A2 [Symbiodinium sp. CCMP2592]|nr:SLC24A2 [Symbiodinium sp. CCMP2592]
MHLAHLGYIRDLVASILVETVRSGEMAAFLRFDGSPDQLLHRWTAEAQSFCKDRGLDCSMKPLTWETLHANKKAIYPELTSRIKASRTRHLLAFTAYYCCQLEILVSDDAPSDTVHWSRCRATMVWCLDAALSVGGTGSKPFLKPEEIIEAQWCFDTFLLSYAHAAARFHRKGLCLYKLRPKMHYTQHLVDELPCHKLNFYHAAIFLDEDHMKFLKIVSAGCHVTSQPRTWARRYLTKQVFLWRRLPGATAKKKSLDTVLGKIRQRSFRPDAPRGEQFQGADAAAAPAAALEDECGVGDMVSSSEDSADEEHPDRELDEAAEAEALGHWHGRVDLAKLGEGGTTFKCGLTITAAYENLDDMPRVLYPRCKQCGLFEHRLSLRDALQRKRAVQERSGDDAELIRALKDALGDEPDLGQKSAFRRLFHEAFSVTTAEMKAIKGQSDSLVDAFVALYEQNRLHFIEWDRLTSKEQEVTSSSKKETVLSVDSSGRLKTEKGEAAKAETTTELLLQFALTRRGIAMEMGNLLDYSLHAKWVERLLCARLDQVPQTHVQTTFNQLQIQLADRELFQLLAERTRSGIQATPSGRPLDIVFEDTWMAPEVLHILQPMPRPSGHAPQIKDTRPGPYTPTGVNTDHWVPTRKGKGKGKNKFRASSRLPAGLEGCRSHTNAGESICYGFNLKTCQEVVTRGRCSKGLRICASDPCRASEARQEGTEFVGSPEAFAAAILAKGLPSKDDVLALARKLPMSPSLRDEAAKSFSTGACVHACMAAPECTFSTVTVLFEDRDLQNHSCENYVFPLSTFSGGELWVEGHGDDRQVLDGKEVIGGPLEWVGDCVKFRPDKLTHFVLPWKGMRGSALLSSVAREAGFDILPIDAGHKVPRAYAHVLRLDLRESLTLQFLENVLRNRAVAWMHFSLPTGTTGRVFRSFASPRGLPNLQEPGASRVLAANAIFDNVATLLQKVLASFPSVGVSVKHPIGSAVWELPAFAQLRRSLPQVTVTACFFGASTIARPSS